VVELQGVQCRPGTDPMSDALRLFLGADSLTNLALDSLRRFGAYMIVDGGSVGVVAQRKGLD